MVQGKSPDNTALFQVDEHRGRLVSKVKEKWMGRNLLIYLPAFPHIHAFTELAVVGRR